MSDEVEKRCAVCAEEMDWTDQQLKACKCGYEVCLWCWHYIIDMAEKDATEALCPACRKPYNKDKIVGMEANLERVVEYNSNRKKKPPKTKQKPNEGKDLSKMRVIQRKMAYIIGLPFSLGDENLLKRKDYFGQYGKVTKVCLFRTAGGVVQQFVNDSCSVYITYSKEEEAVRCIQSIDGYMLDGRLLRASFGTAKYCHTWLRNMTCTNPACLYLHSLGSEEDSFSKEETAAVHTRNRVQEVAGTANYSHRRSGSMLPPPVDEHFYEHSSPTEESVVNVCMKVSACAIGNSADSLAFPEIKDGAVGPSKQVTTFVDIIGHSCSSGSDKNEHSFKDERILNLRSDLSSTHIDRRTHVEADNSGSNLSNSSSSRVVNGLPGKEFFSEPSKESSRVLLQERDDTTYTGPCVTTDDSSLTSHHILKDSVSTCQSSGYFSSQYPSRASETVSDHVWWHKESQVQNDVNSRPQEAYTRSTCLNPVKNDGFKEKKLFVKSDVNSELHKSRMQFPRLDSVLNSGFNEMKSQSLPSSYRINSRSTSLSNEEILEQLRQLDDDKITNDDDENFAVVQNNIITNILSLDFDVCNHSTSSRTVGGPFDRSIGQHSSSLNINSTDQSGFFSKQIGFSSQSPDLHSYFSDVGQVFKKMSIQEPVESKGQFFDKPQYNGVPQYNATRAPSLAPPGYLSKPPGFSSSGPTGQIVSASSGDHFMKMPFPNNHYQTPSIGNVSNRTDILSDPANLFRSQPTPNGLNHNSCLETSSVSSYASQPQNAFMDFSNSQFRMQQSASVNGDQKFSQTCIQPTVPSIQESSYSGSFFGGLTSSLTNQQQMYSNPTSYAQLPSQTQFTNGHIPNGYSQVRVDDMVGCRSEMGILPEARRSDGFVVPGYGEHIFSNSVNVYNHFWDVNCQ